MLTRFGVLVATAHDANALTVNKYRGRYRIGDEDHTRDASTLRKASGLISLPPPPPPPPQTEGQIAALADDRGPVVPALRELS